MFAKIRDFLDYVLYTWKSRQAMRAYRKDKRYKHIYPHW